MKQPGQRLVAATWKKGMKRLVGTENLEFCSGYYNGPTLFRNLLKRSR
jgi:hypothetical protein